MKKLALTLALSMVVLSACGNDASNKEVDHDAHHEESGQSSNEESGHDDASHGHDDGGSNTTSEVITTLEYDGNLIEIALKDSNNKPVTDLEVNHEKLMHMIVVSHDLDQYYHLHPEQKENGVFEVEHKLQPGSYKVFVDIKPKDLNYNVMPMALKVGEQGNHGHATLEPEKEFTKTVNNKTVTMEHGAFETGKSITLDFIFDKGKPEPYLGALGHVVILDEAADEYVHVHPLSDDETKFETSFSKPGIYKIWGEFKFDGTVNIYPFVVEVK